MKKCNYCNGTGKISNTKNKCFKCNGAGVKKDLLYSKTRIVDVNTLIKKGSELV